MDIRYDQWLSSNDLGLYRMDSDPVLRADGVGITCMDGTVPRHLYWEKTERSIRLIPRMTQKIIEVPNCTAAPRWVDDHDFDIRQHVEFRPAPGDGSLRAVLDALPPILALQLPSDRPPWLDVVFEGVDGHKTITVRKQHHAITDGVGGMQLAEATLEFEPDAVEGPLPPMRAPEHISKSDLFVEGWERELGMLSGFLGRQGAILRRAVRKPSWSAERIRTKSAAFKRMSGIGGEAPQSPIMTGRSADAYVDILRYPIESMKLASKRYGGTINDLLMTAVAGGFAEYHRAHSAPVDSLRTTMAINMRGMDDDAVAGNNVSAVMMPLPMGDMNLQQRFDETKQVVFDYRNDIELLTLMTQSGGFTQRLPGDIGMAMARKTLLNVDLAISNVPGIPMRWYRAGIPNEFIAPIGPRVGCAANFTLLSMADEAVIGLNIDPAAIPDAPELVQLVDASFRRYLEID